MSDISKVLDDHGWQWPNNVRWARIFLGLLDRIEEIFGPEFMEMTLREFRDRSWEIGKGVEQKESA